MRIRGWRIEGYGIFEQFRAESLSAGLNVLVGPNEAGKTTLLEFLREMLFGFKLVKGKPERYPARPGLRHGGRLFVETEDGPAVIERYGEKNAPVRVILEDGATSGASHLERWLRGADSGLFRSIFAIGLDELSSLEKLSQDAVRDRIFSAGIAGAGRSARSVIEEMERRMKDLLRPRAAGQINALLAELDKKQGALIEAQEHARRYPDLRAAEEEARQRIHQLEAECDRLRDEKRRYEDLIALWPEWLKRREALNQREALMDEGIRPELASEVEELWAGLEWRRKLRSELAAEQQRLESEQEALAARLVRLGAGWDEARVKDCDLSVTRREQIRKYQKAIEDAREVKRAAADAVERARQAAKVAAAELAHARQRAEAQPSPDAEAVARSEAALRRARACSQNILSLKLQLQAVADRLAAAPAPQRSPLPAVLLASAGAALLAALWLLWAGAMLAALGLVMLAGFFGFLAFLARRSLRPPISVDREALRRQEAELLEKLRSETQELERAAAALNLTADPTPAELEDREAEIAEARRALQERQRLEEAAAAAAARLHALREDLSAAEERLGRAERLLEDSESAWKSFSGTDLSPEGLLQVLTEVERARELLEQCQERADKIAVIKTQTDEWERRAALLTGPGDPGGRLAALRGKLQRLAELEREIQARENAIRTRLGSAADDGVFLAELDAGTVELWRRKVEEAAASLERHARLRDAALIEEQEARKAREALESSADVSRLEIELEGLKQDLSKAVRAWRVAALTKALCEDTLQCVQRERQPAVIAEATRLFQRITSGRYVRILTDPDRRSLALEMPGGALRQLNELSRGTAEQLYLCLRLAFAREFSRHGCNLPLVMDDVLVNFDPRRARLAAQTLAEFAAESQVLLFTCHPETAAVFEDVAPDHRRIDLPAPAEPTFVTAS